MPNESQASERGFLRRWRGLLLCALLCFTSTPVARGSTPVCLRLLDHLGQVREGTYDTAWLLQSVEARVGRFRKELPSERSDAELNQYIDQRFVGQPVDPLDLFAFVLSAMPGDAAGLVMNPLKKNMPAVRFNIQFVKDYIYDIQSSFETTRSGGLIRDYKLTFMMSHDRTLVSREQFFDAAAKMATSIFEISHMRLTHKGLFEALRSSAYKERTAATILGEQTFLGRIGTLIEAGKTPVPPAEGGPLVRFIQTALRVIYAPFAWSGKKLAFFPDLALRELRIVTSKTPHTLGVLLEPRQIYDTVARGNEQEALQNILKTTKWHERARLFYNFNSMLVKDFLLVSAVAMVVKVNTIRQFIDRQDVGFKPQDAVIIELIKSEAASPQIVKERLQRLEALTAEEKGTEQLDFSPVYQALDAQIAKDAQKAP